ncbi:hypothetical protein JIG36_34095 [Actinoplanes sp. LDG1-06]|uniref:ATP-grasp domain-containing protein n=1 Tax=Paractinoplanes ovalisporus TaxID=2810368 RepID=A0ABS2AL55_9ACTN|nr:hypothetical protein [Actinoplanes ovalisporus]MBM2620545.1 hypothetical protein [Actinoplanes ovalisporus]
MSRPRNALLLKWNRRLVEALVAQGVSYAVVVTDYELERRRFTLADLRDAEDIYRIRSHDSASDVYGVAARLLAEDRCYDLVLSPSEFSHYALAVLASVVPGTPMTARQVLETRDKRVMKGLFRRAGVRSSEEYTSAAKAAAALAGGLEPVGVVVKPVDGAGARATVIATSAAELTRAVDQLAGRAQLESGLDGEEYHVDAVWSRGRVTWFSVSRYLRPRARVIPSTTRNGAILLDPDKEADLYASLLDDQRRLIEAGGFETGISHGEFFLTGRGPVWTEIASRPGGAFVDHMVGAATGRSLTERWVDALLGDDGDVEPSPRDPERVVGWLNLGPSRSGTVVCAPAVEEVSAWPGVLEADVRLHTGDQFDIADPSSWSCLVVLEASDSTEWEQRRQVAEMLAQRAFQMAPERS